MLPERKASHLVLLLLVVERHGVRGVDVREEFRAREFALIFSGILGTDEPESGCWAVNGDDRRVEAALEHRRVDLEGGSLGRGDGGQGQDELGGHLWR